MSIAQVQKGYVEVTKRILNWYACHHRDLPWRYVKDPYLIWVSEVMLQQTQAVTVIPYYHRFVRQFPTVEALAAASLDEVLKAWENMGYYTRARNLHRAAKKIVSEMGGEIPESRDELMRLPGIGPYTSAAIMSLAFGKRVPAVDANVYRVVSRLFLIRGLTSGSRTQKRIQELTAKLVPVEDSGPFNQGIMELGATICVPRRPMCNECPVQGFCLAFKEHSQGDLPITKQRGPLPLKHMTAAILRDRRGRLLVVQRRNHGLLGGLWKFPGGLGTKGESLEAALRRTVLDELGIAITVGEDLASVKHAYTHFRITLHGFRCPKWDGKPRALGCHSFQWLRPAEFTHLAFSKADRKLTEALVLCPGGLLK